MHRVSPSCLLALAFALSTATPACVGGPGTRDPGTAEPEPAKQDHLRALADAVEAIDRAPPANLHESAPPRALELLPPQDGPVDPKLLDGALERWSSLPNDTTIINRIPETLLLSHLVLVAENDLARAGGDRRAQLLALERLYSALDQPRLADPRSSTNALIIEALSGMLGMSEDDRNAMAYVDLLFVALRSAGSLHRWTAAELIRSFPDDPSIVGVVDRLAAGLDAHGHYDVALEAKASAVALRGPAATVPQRLALAEACYRALAFDRGDLVLEEARRRASGRFRKTFDDTEHTRADAVRLAALSEARTLEERLDRAALLDDLGRTAEAHRELEAVVGEYPRDVRGHHALARFHVRSYGDFAAAYGVIVDAPEGTEHRDRGWYQLAIAARGLYLLQTFAAWGRNDHESFAFVANPVVGEIRSDTLALAALSDPSADALQLAVDVVERAGRIALDGRARELPVWLGSQVSRAFAVLDRQPADPFAYDLALALAAMTRDRDTATRMLRRAVPPDDKGVRDANRVRLGLAIAVAWQDDARLPGLLREVDALPSRTDPQLRTTVRADVEFVRWRRTADASAGERALEGYTSLVESGVTELRILENLAVLKAHDRAASRAIWTRIVEEHPADSDLARVHLATSVEPPDLAALRRVADEHVGLAGRVAMQWLALLAPSAPERRRWRIAVARLRADAALVEPGGALLPEQGGLALANEMEGGIGYSLETDAATVKIQLVRSPRGFVVPTRSAGGRGA